MTSESPLPEHVGRYRVERELGRGAMGRVLLAEDPVLHREVAIKHLRADLQLAPEQRVALLERMSQEARASARVNHPHLVALFDMGEDETLGLYLVFEYVEGPTLHDRLQQGPLSPPEAARLVRELGDALAYAHGRGIVHRDIKPENVIMSPAGSKLADFGIARLPDSTLTQGTGIVLGTPAYSAPEALRGGKFSPLSDQFSLGATMYEAVSGRRAFPGEDALAVAARITNDDPQRFAAQCGLDRSVDLVFGKVLAKTPKHRYRSTADFGTALADALLGTRQTSAEVLRAPMPTLPDHFHTERRSRSTFVFTALVAVASAALTLGVTTAFDPVSVAASVAPKAVTVARAEENPPPVAWLAPSPEDSLSDSTPAAPRPPSAAPQDGRANEQATSRATSAARAPQPAAASSR